MRRGYELASFCREIRLWTSGRRKGRTIKWVRDSSRTRDNNHDAVRFESINLSVMRYQHRRNNSAICVMRTSAEAGPH